MMILLFVILLLPGILKQIIKICERRHFTKKKIYDIISYGFFTYKFSLIIY